ncbi:hypothetical protein D3C77_809050 [compost metagenome]
MSSRVMTLLEAIATVACSVRVAVTTDSASNSGSAASVGIQERETAPSSTPAAGR